jgi:hypothetical protein
LAEVVSVQRFTSTRLLVMPSYGLLCPFLDESPSYAHGVEFGMLWALMRTETIIKDYFTTANQEQITLAANRMGWKIIDMKPWGKDWVLIHMEKQ